MVDSPQLRRATRASFDAAALMVVLVLGLAALWATGHAFVAPLVLIGYAAVALVVTMVNAARRSARQEARRRRLR